MFIALLLGSQVPSQIIDYRIEMRDSRGVVARPVIKVRANQTAEITVFDRSSKKISFKVAPELLGDEITNHIEVKLTLNFGLTKPIKSDRLVVSTFRTHSGQTMYMLFTQDKDGWRSGDWLWEKPRHKVARGEYMLTMNAAVETK